MSFQGHQTNVTLQFKKNIAFFFNGVHCFAHKMNIIVFTLLALDMVHQFESFLKKLYVFFPHSPKTWWLSMFSLANKVYVEYHLLIVKRHFEFAKNEVVLKNLNSLCNVSSFWDCLVSCFT
jgi:hypothetical protein